jgi:molybdopterin/thiamine biosynthesis adenylyltransferase
VTPADLGRAKVESAREKLIRLNPNIKIDTYQEFLTPETAPEIFKNYDFVVECSDNFQTKYLVNDACVAVYKPFSLGGIRMLGGQTMTHIPGTACYRCLFPIEPDPSTVPNSSSVGVLGSAVGIIGSIQATETIKYITGIGTLLTDRLLVADASTMTFNTISLPRNPKCPLCSEK